MFKALLKKQMREINSFYFVDRKTGKLRSKASVTRTIVLYAVLFVFVAISLGSWGFALGAGLANTEYDWLYFAMEGLMAFLLGTFGSVFNTFNGLYKAKDNDLLLSMPIKPVQILTVRMISVYAMSLLYSALVWVPAVILYWVFTSHLTVLQFVFPVLLTFIIPVFITVITCALGWVVAVISTKLKGKSFTRVLLAVVFIGVYYVFCGKIGTFLTAIVADPESYAKGVKLYAYPFLELGYAGVGKIVPFLIFLAITAGLMAICLAILSRSYIKIVTTNHGEKKVKYEKKQAKLSSVSKALYRKELKHFTTSSTYMLNCGLGLILLPIGCIVLLIKASVIGELMAMVNQEIPEIAGCIISFLACLVCMLTSMNQISAPSVSLEGRSIWLAQSLPVTSWQVLKAKLELHFKMNLLPTVICTVVLGIVFKASVLAIIMMVLMSVAFLAFMDVLGLALNLKKPNLIWTNETVPIKQSMAVTVGLFGGWVLVAILGFGAYLLRMLPGWLYILIATVVLLIPTAIITRWLKNKGTEIFASL